MRKGEMSRRGFLFVLIISVAFSFIIIPVLSEPSTWVNTGNLENATEVYSLFHASDGAIYAGTENGDGSWDSAGVVFKTTDGGTTWVPTASLGGVGVAGNIEAIIQTSGGTIDNNIFIGTSWEGKIFRSTNGGINWIQVVGLPNVVEVDSLIQAANGDLYAGTHYSYGAIDEARIYRSSNYGDNWEVVAAASIDGELSGSVYVECLIQASTGYFYCGTYPGNVWRSDNGDNWYKVGDKDNNFGGSYKIYSILDASDGRIYVASRNPGNVYRSADNGDTWAEVANGTTELGGATRTDGLCQASNGTILVGTNVGKIYRSDDGDNWVLEATLPADRINAIIETNPDQMYAGTSSNGDVFTAYILPERAVEVWIEPLENWGVRGEKLVYTVTVKNIGNTWDNYVLNKTDELGWLVTKNFAWVPLAPGSFASVDLEVTIPENAAPYSVDVITVTATSQIEPIISDNATSKAFGPNLVTGWNLVCFTGANESDTPRNLFSELNYLTDYVIYWWEAPSGPYHLQGPDEVFKDNLGYWVSTNKDEAYRTTGIEPASRGINMIPGWNLVGFPITNENTTPNNIFTGLIYFTDYFIYHWTAPGGPYVLMNPGEVLENVLGYWVWINQDKTVTVP